MIKFLAIPLILSTPLISGCFEEEQERQTVEWWLEHDEERDQFLQECMNDSVETATPNCLNARMAQERVAKRRVIGDGHSMKSVSTDIDWDQVREENEQAAKESKNMNSPSTDIDWEKVREKNKAASGN